MEWVKNDESRKGNCACPVCDHVPIGGGIGFGEMLYAKDPLRCGNCGIKFNSNTKEIINDADIRP